jgi:hypothetical protein
MRVVTDNNLYMYVIVIRIMNKKDRLATCLDDG